ncbi:unnamed protein product [Oppiella nova]|uniref:Nucleolar protein 16 n=1 Tax=Oppiella nova TaxID=334625 RepID=A0A7R9LLQ4_9ACAR|nr:unnamed protein product [Oppiella nova]CAG2164234.1 unnamed protein product [Oppiella nova]
MGKAKGVSRRRKAAKSQRFVHKTKLKKQRNKMLKKNVKIECKSIRESWDQKKNMNANMTSMGLSLDPNKTLSKVMSKSDVKSDQRKKDKTDTKSKVISELEDMANKPQPKNFRFGPKNIKFCIYMIEKYGDNYEAMARDPTNYYQESVGQIRSKINKFRSIPSNWNSYMKAKQLIDSSNTTQRNVQFTEDTFGTVGHDSDIDVRNTNQSLIDVHLGFLQVRHRYGITLTFSCPDSMEGSLVVRNEDSCGVSPNTHVIDLRSLVVGKGTPLLKNGIKCIGIEMDEDEDGDNSDWPGFAN